MEDLVSTAQTVEDTVCYNMGTRQTEGQSGNHVAPQRPIPMWVRSTTVPRLPQDTVCAAKDHIELRFNVPATDEAVCAKNPQATPRDQSYQDD